MDLKRYPVQKNHFTENSLITALAHALAVMQMRMMHNFSS